MCKEGSLLASTQRNFAACACAHMRLLHLCVDSMKWLSCCELTCKLPLIYCTIPQVHWLYWGSVKQ